MSQLVDQFLVSFRTLELTTAKILLEKLETSLNGNVLTEYDADRITRVVFPIFYPGDSGVSKLGFSIQCEAAMYLINIAPWTRRQIMQSILDIFTKFSYVFAARTPIANVLKTLARVDEFWNLFAEECENLSVGDCWTFFLYCFSATEAGKRERADHKIVLKLLTEKKPYQHQKWGDVLNCLEKVVVEWGPCCSIAQALAERACYEHIKDDIPAFILDESVGPIDNAEKLIDVMSMNCTELSTENARTLSCIVRNHFESNMFQISLYLALMKRSPPNYIGALAARLKNAIRGLKLNPVCAAHVTAISASCRISLMSDVFSLFEKNTEEQSLFFACLSHYSESFDGKSVVTLLIEALNSAVLSYGICKFVVSLLSLIMKRPNLLDDKSLLVPYIDSFLHYVTDRTVNQMMSSEVTVSFIPEKIVALIAAITETTVSIPLQVDDRICHVCALHAYLFRYAHLELEKVVTYYLISELYQLTHLQEIFQLASQHKLPGMSFPPTEYLLSSENSSIIASICQKKGIITGNIIRHISGSTNIQILLRSLWQKVPLEAVPDVIRKLATINSLSESRELLLEHLKDKDFVEVINPCFGISAFRSYFINHILRIVSRRSAQGFNIARKMNLNKPEYEEMAPVVRAVLEHNDGSRLVKVAAMRFVAEYFSMDQSLSSLCQNLAIISLSTLSKSNAIESSADYANSLELKGKQGNCYIETMEIAAALGILSKAWQSNPKSVEPELKKIHSALYQASDPRIRYSYLKFLGELGQRGLSYALEVAPVVSLPWF